jgi:hypothetical protein
MSKDGYKFGNSSCLCAVILIVATQHVLILSLCFAGIASMLQASTIQSIGKAEWGVLRGAYNDVTDKFEYCKGKHFCGVHPTVDWLGATRIGIQVLWVSNVRCSDGSIGGFGGRISYMHAKTHWYITCYS